MKKYQRCKECWEWSQVDAGDFYCEDCKDWFTTVKDSEVLCIPDDYIHVDGSQVKEMARLWEESKRAASGGWVNLYQLQRMWNKAPRRNRWSTSPWLEEIHNHRRWKTAGKLFLQRMYGETKWLVTTAKRKTPHHQIATTVVLLWERPKQRKPHQNP